MPLHPLSRADALRQAGWQVMQPDATARIAPIPLCGVAIPAGFPSPAEGYLEETLSLDQYLITDEAATLLVRAKGDSMQGAHILDGDLLVVDRGRSPQSGNIVIAALDGEFTVKRLVIRSGQVWLKAENPAYPALCVQPEQEFEVFGVVCGVARKY